MSAIHYNRDIAVKVAIIMEQEIAFLSLYIYFPS
jgi:hypothetical protein